MGCTYIKGSAAHIFKDKIDPFWIFFIQDLVQIFFPIVDDSVAPKLFEMFGLVTCPASTDYMIARLFCQLYGILAEAACSGRYQNGFI